MLEPDPQGKLPTKDAFFLYQSWCEQNGYRPGNFSTFGKNIKGYVEVSRPYIDGKQQTCIMGYQKKQGSQLSGQTELEPDYHVIDSVENAAI